MKKYVIKYKKDGRIFGEYKSREEASKKLMKHINIFNDGLEYDYISPFDFVLEEVEVKEVNEVITDFESARKALGSKPNVDFTVAKKILSGNVVHLEDVTRLVTDINSKHIEALIALNELFTIAQAWNKEDEFVPDFSDWKQDKWFPWFEYDMDAARFVSVHTGSTPAYASAHFGSRLCFKSAARAAQFGKQFEELYNKVFL